MVIYVMNVVYLTSGLVGSEIGKHREYGEGIFQVDGSWLRVSLVVVGNL